MITVQIPGLGELRLEHLVLDYNGTLAVDGVLLPGVAATLRQVAEHLNVHVVTADTFGKVHAQMNGLPATISILPSHNMHVAKLNYIKALGLESTVAIGNGRNDRDMLKHAALGICVLQCEGASVEALQNSRAVVPDILDGLSLLLHPQRMVATLRS